mmetsp:Transcript_21905/g.55912  ORF Transcript_21905/g.55912 Transcript_21905/m.55912 type:complete len:222 (+) Transcript_21905:117-782(+)
MMASRSRMKNFSIEGVSTGSEPTSRLISSVPSFIISFSISCRSNRNSASRPARSSERAALSEAAARVPASTGSSVLRRWRRGPLAALANAGATILRDDGLASSSAAASAATSPMTSSVGRSIPTSSSIDGAPTTSRSSSGGWVCRTMSRREALASASSSMSSTSSSTLPGSSIVWSTLSQSIDTRRFSSRATRSRAARVKSSRKEAYSVARGVSGSAAAGI